ncbi:MAG TPA: hypothetical protein VGK89_10435 [Candidatus Eisenbacteria bacterium]|jgi:hypothetical protein
MNESETHAPKLLGPAEYAPRLRELIEGARRELWLVSPSAHLNELQDVLRAILDSARRGVHVHLVMRDQVDQMKVLEAFGPALIEAHVRLLAVEGLRAALYWSEEQALLGSLELRGASFAKGVEIGLLVPKGELHARVRDFIGAEITFQARKIAAVGGARAESKGHCIRCGVSTPFDLERPFCWADFQSWVAHQDADEEEKFCHRCGRSAATSRRQPLCAACRTALRSTG